MSFICNNTGSGRRRIFMAACCLAVFLVAGLYAAHQAQALRLSMKRIIFEGPKRSDIITIMNNTASEQTYRLGWRHYRMDEKKSLIYLGDDAPDDGSVKWADDMIRFAPRRVTVPPGGSQQIRLLLRRPRDLAPGEYRSHLWIVTEVQAESFDDENNPEKGRQAFKLTMQPALTLPVFVRHGELSSGSSITEARLSNVKEGKRAVSFHLNRDGNRSLYGDLKVICTAAGHEYEASHTRGIAVYTEVTKRILDFDFKYPPEQEANCRRVRIEYIADREDSLYAGQIMAKADAQLQ